MVRRRKLLASFGTIGGAVALAGCSGSGEPDETVESDQQSESEPEQSQEQQEPVDPLPGITVENVNLTYGFSSGLRSRIQLSSDTNENPKNVFTKIEAFAGDRSVESKSTWSEFTFSTEVDLTLENIGSLSDTTIDDITEFAVTGRVENGESGDIERLTGDELRDRVDG